MGNVHALAHRATAVSVAGLATAGFIFCFLGGFSCNFLSISPLSDRVLMTPDGLEFEDGASSSFGIQCDSPFLTEEEEDRMWNLSQIFLYIGLTLGGLTNIVAWILSVILPPSNRTWRSLSVLSAATAVMEVPMFLLFETEPCNMDINRQTCKVSSAGYFTIVSIVMYVVMAIWTQVVQAPDWTKETDAWKNTREREEKVGRVISVPSPDGSRAGTDDETAPHDASPSTRSFPPPSRSTTSDRRGLVQPRNLSEIFPTQDLIIEEDEEQVDEERTSSNKSEARYPFDHQEQEIGVDVLENFEPVVPKVEEEEVVNTVVENKEKRRSFWKSASLFALASRRKEDVAKKEIDEEEGLSVDIFPVEQVVSIHEAEDDAEIASPDFRPNEIVNRETSLLTLSQDDDDDHDDDVHDDKHLTGVEAKEETVLSRGDDKAKDAKKGISFGFASFSNRLRPSSMEQIEAPNAVEEKEKSMKFTVICPDGTQEVTRNGKKETTIVPILKKKEESNIKIPRSNSSKQRDVVLTHNITRPKESIQGKSNANAEVKDILKSTSQRDVIVTHNISRPSSELPQRQKEARACPPIKPVIREPVEGPMKSFFVPPIAPIQTFDGDVSDITPGPDEVKQDTMAILHDLVQSE